MERAQCIEQPFLLQLFSYLVAPQRREQRDTAWTKTMRWVTGMSWTIPQSIPAQCSLSFIRDVQTLNFIFKNGTGRRLRKFYFAAHLRQDLETTIDVIDVMFVQFCSTMIHPTQEFWPLEKSLFAQVKTSEMSRINFMSAPLWTKTASLPKITSGCFWAF